ncbi:cryptochrome/photolyase family protein [Marinobacterium jannaschii]|uniref:cryptochrome/photolyase family protein n=1 Tax=Marinobacterium jannaschii TaxID=64970 RepID=UPI00048402BD|nr:FAD-binding domain-containing protein [Marinobacterium jannaschii]
MKLLWLRNDLRLGDNPALFYACSTGQPVTAVVAETPEQWAVHDDAPAKIGFWRDNLAALQPQLAALNIPLKRLRVARFDQVAEAIAGLAAELGANALFFNNEYPLNEQRRDQQVADMLAGRGIGCQRFDGDLVMPPGSVLNGQGAMFKVFTPFSRAWRQRYLQQLPGCLGMPSAVPPSPVTSDPLAANDANYRRDLWPASEDVAHRRLQNFVAQRVQGYGEQRDYPDINGTSLLSPYLSCGVLSVRQCIAALQAGCDGDSWLESQWLTELIWREFYRHLLLAFPEMSKLQPFRPEVEQRIRWRHEPELFQRWCEGETGFPIVDAAMKQLQQTHWMHNRLRMVTASFLTKLLGVDWRLGAGFFMRNLIDGDFASNLGGWQWSASVGADAAPYFRIFSPQRQAERFDPEGRFVKRFLPQLEPLPAKKLHLPGAGAAEGLRPEALVDYSAARKRALQEYQDGA